MNATVEVALIGSLGVLVAGIVAALFLVNRNRADALNLITQAAEKVVGVSDKNYDRLEARAQRWWHAAERLIDVFEPWVARVRPPSIDDDSVTATFYAADYLAGRNAIHDAREDLR